MKDELRVEPTGDVAMSDEPVQERRLPAQRVTTTISVIELTNGSIELQVHSDLPKGAEVTNGMVLVQRMLKLADDIMREALYVSQDEAIVERD